MVGLPGWDLEPLLGDHLTVQWIIYLLEVLRYRIYTIGKDRLVECGVSVTLVTL